MSLDGRKIPMGIRDVDGARSKGQTPSCTRTAVTRSRQLGKDGFMDMG